MAMAAGGLAFAAVPWFAIRAKSSLAWVPLFFLAILALSLGGIILALAEDPTIFLATLMSSVFTLVVIWYERAFKRLRGAEPTEEPGR